MIIPVVTFLLQNTKNGIASHEAACGLAGTTGLAESLEDCVINKQFHKFVIGIIYFITSGDNSMKCLKNPWVSLKHPAPLITVELVVWTVD